MSITYVEKIRDVLVDLIWVRPRSPSGDSVDDIAENYESEEEVERRWSEVDDELAELVHERAEAFSRGVHSKAKQVRGKAKTLFNASSFVSAILFGLGAVYLRTVPNLGWPWLVVFGLFYIVMVAHFLRAIYIAISVMTRERAIRQSPKSITAFIGDSGSKTEAVVKSAAQLVSFANQTDEFVNERINKLIVGQTAFRNGLIWFAVSLFIVGSVSLGHRHDSRDTSDLTRVRTDIEALSSELERLRLRVDRLTTLQQPAPFWKYKVPRPPEE